nr:MAG TPA_asm: hypothetical protein [Caudoviricetes sp.]
MSANIHKTKGTVVVWHSKEWGNCIRCYRTSFITLDDT